MNRLQKGLFFSLIALSASSAFAFVEDRHSEMDSGLLRGKRDKKVEEKVLRPESVVSSSIRESEDMQGLQVIRDKKTGRIRLLHGVFEGVDVLNTSEPSAYVELSKHYVDQHPEIFETPSSSLKELPSALYVGKDEQFVRFHVYRDGLRVKDASVDFRFKFGKLLQISNQTFAEAESVNLTERQDLLEKAGEALNAKSITPQGFVYRVVETANGYALEKVASFAVQSETNMPYTLELDVSNGKVYELNRNFYNYQGNVRGDFYPRWYDEPLASYPYPLLSVQSTKGEIRANQSGRFEAAADSAPQLTDGLRGPYVTVKDTHNANVSAKGVLNGSTWDVYVKKEGNAQPWMDTRIAQSMIYDKVTAMIQFAKKYIDMPWFSRSLVANANLDSHCNAYWDGSTINLFTGNEQCANTGLIADVMYHEWGHGLHHNAEGIEDGALSEGFGDIMSLVMTHSNLLGIGFMLSNRAPVRDIKPARIYPRDRGEVHSEGTIIASTFWELFEKLTAKYGEAKAGDMIANYAFKMIFTSRTYLDVYHALLVIDSKGGDPSKGTPNQCLLNEVFHNHGLAEKEAACELASVDAWEVDGGSNVILKPGTTVDLRLKAKNAASQVLHGLQGTLSTQDLPGAVFEEANLRWEDIPSGASLYSENAARLRIPASAKCGLNFHTNVNLKAGSRELTLTKEWVLGRNEGVAKSYASTQLPQPIKDFKTASAVLKASDAKWQADTKVLKAELKFDLTHSFLGDLIISLKAPDGTTTQVYKGSGRGQGSLHFNAEIPALKGKNISGDWTLLVKDSAASDEGTLSSFTLLLTPALFSCE